MGTPCMSFLEDEYKWSREKAALTFGLVILVLGLPTVLFFNYGVFDEYDYWAGTVSLVVFALAEVVLFSWVFGIKKGWAELMEGADIKIPNVYKYITLYITPVLLGAVFIASLPEIWSKIINKDIYEKIATATDSTVIAELQKTLLFVNISRIGLIFVFAVIAFMVYKAYQKRLKEGKNLTWVQQL